MKQCSKCKEWKDESEFNKHKMVKSGLYSSCKLCRAIERSLTKEEHAAYVKVYNKLHREEKRLYDKEYRKKRNASKVKIIKVDRSNDLDFIAEKKKRKSESDKRYREQHKDVLKDKERIKYLRRKDIIKEHSVKSVPYNMYADKLTVDESSRLAEDGISLEVKCRYCGKYFKPTYKRVQNRIQSLLGNMGGEAHFYCSDKCKRACPIFNQYKYPKGHIDSGKWQSREVQAELRQMVFELDEWECQRCGVTTQEAELHCHHLTGVELNPIESADVDNCITLCEFHHDELHKRKGCTYADFRRKACVTEEN